MPVQRPRNRVRQRWYFVGRSSRTNAQQGWGRRSGPGCPVWAAQRTRVPAGAGQPTSQAGPSVVVYGISGGGPIAIEFARRYPERAEALILESAVTRHYAPAISPIAKTIYLSPLGTWLTAQLVQRLPRAALHDFVRQESTLDRQARRATVDWILADDQRLAYAKAVMAALTPFEDRAAGLDNDLRQWARLDDSTTAGITCPTLILHGTHDGDADPAHARHAATTIPQATLHLVPSGWHLLPLSINGATTRQARSTFLAE
ncbi:alpha/beta hydrolase [Solwaraspora sp. WMMD937]|uniref:alpha/beta fold hydrolase n=1 Tax=Solwaraspora sp. WMMD937 TaxID=3016090 RepID=UPI00249B3573|nr:alpha/beta hydrolase [Solwaraspora sp. WMMD937]WFE24561.1 alpha/beta hydrolase [Solwaraspora sp. WMMD937]